MLLIATAVIVAAVWTVSEAVVENMRFAEGTSQILQLIASTHVLADRDKNFATQPNEDVFNDLTRAGLLTGATDDTPATLTNPWKGLIHATSPLPSFMRVETDVPAHDCRRLALFFIKNSSDLGLNILEVREGNAPVWQRFYAPANGITVSNSKTVEDACERASNIRLALVFKIR